MNVEVQLRGQHLVQAGEKVIVTTDQGRRTLEDAALSVTQDRVTLSTDHQTLSFFKDGTGAKVTDHREGTAYQLGRTGTFRYRVAGFEGVARPSADGTLLLPHREVNPLLPLEDVLPQVELSKEPTPRISRVRAAAHLIGDYPWVAGVAVGAGAFFLGDFGFAAITASATTLACLALRAWPQKAETYSVLDGGALVGGELTTHVRRGSAPEPGQSRGSRLRVKNVKLRLRNGLELIQNGSKLQVGNGKTHQTFDRHYLTLDSQEVSVHEPSGTVHQIQNDGTLSSTGQGSQSGEFGSVYQVLKNQTEPTHVKELEFAEDEVHFDEFQLPYDH